MSTRWASSVLKFSLEASSWKEVIPAEELIPGDPRPVRADVRAGSELEQRFVELVGNDREHRDLTWLRPL